MIEKARAYAAHVPFDANFIHADFYDFECRQCFDVIYTSAWMYSTIQSRESRIKFLHRCRELMSDDCGVAVVSYHPLPTPPKSTFSLHHRLAKTIGLLTGGNRSVKFGDCLTNGLFWHYFRPSDVIDEVRQAKMKILAQVHSPNGTLDSLILTCDESDSECTNKTLSSG